MMIGAYPCGTWSGTRSETDSQSIKSTSTFFPRSRQGEDQTTLEGSAVSLDPATFTHPGSGENHIATINWGDGLEDSGAVDQASNTVSGSHAYSDNGVNTVEVCVRIDGGSPGCDTFTVTVNNVAPTATFGNDGPVNEGSSFTLSLSNPTDPGDDSFRMPSTAVTVPATMLFQRSPRPPAPPQTTGYE